MTDQYVRRTGDDYGEAFAKLFPTGPAWPQDEQTVFQRVIRALAQIFGYVDERAGVLLQVESDPRSTFELLEEWERAFGLPDECVAEPLSIEDRRKALLNRMTSEGGQSRAFFISVAAALGYTITIREYSPFMAGISQAGDTREDDVPGLPYRWEVGDPNMRFYWTVDVGATRLSWFRAGSGQAGIDPHLRIGLATDLECVFRRWKPAQTEVVFNYAGLADGGEFAGLP